MSKYINYEELMDSDWIFCAKGDCSNCQYAEGDRDCKISNWIDSLPKYEMKMERIEE